MMALTVHKKTNIYLFFMQFRFIKFIQVSLSKTNNNKFKMVVMWYVLTSDK